MGAFPGAPELGFESVELGQLACFGFFQTEFGVFEPLLADQSWYQLLIPAEELAFDSFEKVRLWQEIGDVRLLLVGLGGLFCLASGIALTSFMRRPEYGAKPPTEDGQPAEVGKRGPVAIVEWAARVVVHYPQYIWICAATDRMDIYFWAYTGVNALYFAKSMATILFKLGRFA